jgi:hypothetical protein
MINRPKQPPLRRARRAFAHFLLWAVPLVLLAACAFEGARLPAATPTATWTVTPEPTFTPVPSPTPTATPTPAPTAVPTQVDGYQVSAWVAVDRPGFGSYETVYGKLLKEDVGVEGALMYVIVHYRDRPYRFPDSGYVTTDQEGVASITFDMSGGGGAAPAYVDVYLAYAGQVFETETSFAPQC